MLRIATGAAAAVLLMSSSAFAWETPKPPAPPTQTQSQEQYQRQQQQQTQKAYGGAGGAGGASNAASTSNAASSAAGGTSTVNNNVSAGNNTGNGNGTNGYGYPQFPASTATAPSYAIGECQFAVSGGAQAFLFGASAGGAGMYEFCKTIRKADYFRKQGLLAQAKALECKYDEFRDAHRQAGAPCREDMTKEQLAQPAATQQAPIAGETRGQCYARLNAAQALTSDNARLCSQLGA